MPKNYHDEKTDCDCKKHDFPLASFCNDDLYCAQCRAPVAWLNSPNELPNPDPVKITSPHQLVWVYAPKSGGKDNRFKLPLDYRALNNNHLIMSRDLILVEDLCRIETHYWNLPYNFELEFITEEVKADKNHYARYVGIRLKTDPRLIEEYGEEWTNDDQFMPVDGISCTLTLFGNCGERTFNLLAFGEPRYEIEVCDGNGQPLQDRPSPTDDSPEPVDHAWVIARRGEHELKARIHCNKGFLHLPEVGEGDRELNPTISKPKDDFTYRPNLPRDRMLGPGHGPCEITINFDSTDWEPGEYQTVRVTFSPDVLVTDLVEVPLYLEPRGVVKFDPESELRIPEMYFGEVTWSQREGTEGARFLHVKVSNIGEKLLEVRRPSVERKDLPDIEWIQVNWAKKQPDPAEVPCISDVFLELSVKIDLSRVTAANHKSGEPLSATIFIESEEDELLPWQLPVLVQSVDARPGLESYLAIDFGNSNTYAVYVKGDRLVPALGGRDPENFPTALYFQDVPDPALLKVEIGKEAVARGQKDPSTMVPWLLKRWLLDDKRSWETPWPIRTGNGQLCRLRRGELIRIFIEKVILECEKALRMTVTKVGLSYPANFGPRARRRLDEVLTELEKRRKAEYPHLADEIRIERVADFDSSPDEASAVAIGFVHDPERYEKEIVPALGPEKTFLVASFDFGGGSIDSALLRFKSIGDRLPQFESAHLSLGGDENFGGDNVTIAVSQLLLERFRTLLKNQSPVLEFLVADGNDGNAAGTDPWNNYQHLRVLAEELKRYLCQLEPAPEGEPMASPSIENSGRARTTATGDPQALEPLKFAVTTFTGRIKLRNPATNQVAPSAQAAALRDPLCDALLTITLDEVYRHPIFYDAELGLTYRVDKRVEKCISELHDFVEKAKKGAQADPLFIVLAGAACRLPLVRKLIETRFDRKHVIGDPLREPDSKPKSKVAFGMARYLEYVNTPARVERLSRAGRYTHGPIIWKGGIGETVVWVPTCSELRSDQWHPLDRIHLSLCLSRAGKIYVYHQAFRSELIGWFDLTKAATEGDAGLNKKLPDRIDAAVPCEVLLMVNGSEDNLLLKIHYGKPESGEWHVYGYWKLTRVDEDVADQAGHP